jgi:hypothetical protein
MQLQHSDTCFFPPNKTPHEIIFFAYYLGGSDENNGRLNKFYCRRPGTVFIADANKHYRSAAGEPSHFLPSNDLKYIAALGRPWTSGEHAYD